MKKLLRSISTTVSTLGPLGQLPAPGTWATLLTTGVLWYCCSNHVLLGTSYALLCVISMLVCLFILRTLDSSSFAYPDHPSIVIDEVVGTLMVFGGVPLTPLTVIGGIILFRFFDIVKPLGIWRLQLLSGAWGILADDIAAGLVSNGILRLCCAIVAYLC